MIKKVAATAVGALLALTVGAAGAYFTAQVQVPDSVINAGSIDISTEPTVAPLSIDALAPGMTVNRTMAVVNTGSLPASVTVTSVKKAGITEFYDALTCRVVCNNMVRYDGPLADLRTTSIKLTPGARSELQFQVGLPETVGNTLAGDYVKLSLYVDGEQIH